MCILTCSSPYYRHIVLISIKQMPMVVRVAKTTVERNIAKWVSLRQSAKEDQFGYTNAAGLLMIATYFNEDNYYLLKEVEVIINYCKISRIQLDLGRGE